MSRHDCFAGMLNQAKLLKPLRDGQCRRFQKILIKNSGRGEMGRDDYDTNVKFLGKYEPQ